MQTVNSAVMDYGNWIVLTLCLTFQSTQWTNLWVILTVNIWAMLPVLPPHSTDLLFSSLTCMQSESKLGQIINHNINKFTQQTTHSSVCPALQYFYDLYMLLFIEMNHLLLAARAFWLAAPVL